MPPLVPGQRKQHRCKHCDAIFTTAQALSRHSLHRCKIALTAKATEADMQKRLDDVQAQNAEIMAEMVELKSLLKGQTPSNVHSHITQTVNVVNIVPWALEPTLIRASDLVAVFAKNPRLEEYCYLSEADKIDAEGAAPYILEALIEFVKRAHADPSARNIYLNPRRADQVLVFAEESWKTLSLVEAIRTLFDGVSGGIKQTIKRPQTLIDLPQQLVGAASYVPMLYDDEPESYVKRAKGPMAAHLTNTAPKAEARIQSAQRSVSEPIESVTNVT